LSSGKPDISSGRREANMSTKPFFEKDDMCRPHPYRISRRFFSAWRVGGLQRGGTNKYSSLLAIADASAGPIAFRNSEVDDD
jgi:hypothetical protein